VGLPGAQSLFVAQAVLQDVPLHMYGAQAEVVAAWQFPFPSQLRAEVRVEPLVGQEAVTQVVPAAYFWQAPLPSQTPSVPQVEAPLSEQVAWGSFAPAGTLVQTPSEVVSAHDWQAPLHALLQQYPWAQKLEPHSALLAQVWPFPLRPHDPLLQMAGEAQSAFEVQVFLHTPVPHRYGKQEAAAGVTHAPAPLQVDVFVKVVVVEGQVEARQLVPDA